MSLWLPPKSLIQGMLSRDDFDEGLQKIVSEVFTVVGEREHTATG